MTIVKPKPLDGGFQTPWEKKGEEYDPEKGRAFIHYLSTQAFEQQEAAAKATADLATVTSERDGYKSKVEEAQRANETDVERLTRERDEALAKAKKVDEPDIDKLKLEVAFEKGLTKVQMKRLVGATKEELESDADDLLKEWNPTKKDDDGDGDGDADNPATQPKSGLRNPADPKPLEGRFDAEKAADEYVATSRIF
jgi:hypothetical protein